LISLYNSISNIRGSVLIKYKYTPREVEKFEFQSDDYRGLFFIYNQILEEIAYNNKEIKKK
jgi:hypothetical protein